MSAKDNTINKTDPLSAKTWREVYNLVSIIENMRVYNKELVDKYVKDINEKIYYLANQKRIQLNNSIRKPSELIVSIDKTRIDFQALKAFNPELENQIPVIDSYPKNVDFETRKQNIELKKPSFYFNHEDRTSFDILLSVTEDIINSFSSSNSNSIVESQFINKNTISASNGMESDDGIEKVIPHNPLVENSELTFCSQKKDVNILSQINSYEKRKHEKCQENQNENFEFTISRSNKFTSETEETDYSFDHDSSEEFSCQILDENLNETNGDLLKKLRRKSSDYQFPAVKLRRSKRILSSIITKEKMPEKLFSFQEHKRKRSLLFKVIIT